MHLVNQGQLAVEVFFILSGMFFYNSASGAHLMQAHCVSRCAQFIITRYLRLWPTIVFCSILLLPSPMVPNRAAAPWTLLFASNHLPWNKQFMSWLWSDSQVSLSLIAYHVPNRSISVDAQYFVFSVIVILACSCCSSRAPALLTFFAMSAAISSVTLSIQGASDLISAPVGSELRVPMPVIGIDWMQVLTQSLPTVVLLSAVIQEGAMNPAIDAFYSNIYLRCVLPESFLHSFRRLCRSAVRRCLPWLMGLAVAHLTRKSSHSSALSLEHGIAKTPQSLAISALITILFLLVIPCMNTTTAASRFLSPTHATLFLALHRPAFSLFVASILVRFQSGYWQQQFMKERYFQCFEA
jgi:hypothetical protein